jgi:hypothetical protein
MWNSVVLRMFTDVLEVCVASMFKAEEGPSILKMKTAGSFEMSELIFETTVSHPT